MNTSPKIWHKDSWRDLPRVQQPTWQDDPKLKKVEEKLSKLPPLVFVGEVMQLRRELCLVEAGEAFVIQGGDCAETFEQCRADVIRENLKVLLQMSIVLTYSAGKHVVKIGRIAGQYAKPRTSNFEDHQGLKLPVYRGDMVNLATPNLEARQNNPENVLHAYFHATSTLNLLRGYTKGGLASLANVHSWNKEFVKDTPQGKKYDELARKIDKNLSFMRAVGLNDDLHQLREVNFYTSHEALILEYESALTRKDSLSDKILDCSAHMVWIGERTRSLEGAHVEFCRGIVNPVGIKIGPSFVVEEIISVVGKLNPKNEPGKIVLIPRLGKGKAYKLLPPLLKELKAHSLNFSLFSDPMHGNTFTHGKYKTRHFNDILQEIKEVAECLVEYDMHLGGIHIETTGLSVTECLGGMHNIDAKALELNYNTSCDPRLNSTQSVELAFLLAMYL